MAEANVYSYEFDLLEFLRDQFDHVRLGMPIFEGDEHLWRATYVLMFGLNEVARFHRDRVELQIYCDVENLRFHAFSARGDLLEKYREVIRRVGAGDIDAIMKREGLPTEYDGQLIDHRVNLESINYLLGKSESLTVAADFQDLPSAVPTMIELAPPPGVMLGRLAD
jgi:hypothetical protein